MDNMDLNQEVESNQQLESNQPSRRCHSRLSDALIYAESGSGRASSVGQSPERESYVERSPGREQAAAGSPGRERSFEIPLRAASDNTLSVDGKINVSRSPSTNVKMYDILTPTKLDLISASALSSPEPSVFDMAYRFDSPPPLTARPLPPIKGRQDEMELQLKQQKLDTIKIQNKFEFFEIEIGRNNDLKTSDTSEKDGKDDESVQAKHPNFKNDSEDINVSDKVDIPPQKSDEPDVPVSTLKVPKPPLQPKGHTVVHDIKSSRLRKSLLQIKNELPDVKQVLSPVKAPNKFPAQSTVASTELPKHRSANIKLRTSASPIHVVRETKTTKLRRLKKIEDEKEKEAMRQEEQDRLKDMAFEPRLARFFQPKRSPTPTFKPAPPIPYKKPEPVAIKETKASKLRKRQEVKKTENKPPGKIVETSKETQQLQNQRRSPTPTFQPAPPKAYKKPAPVAIRETRASKLRQLREVTKNTENKLPIKGIKTSNGTQQPPHQRRTQEQCHEITSSESQASRSSQFQGKRQIRNEMKRAKAPMAHHLLPPISRGATGNTVGSQRETTPAIHREMRESRKLHQRYVQDEKLVSTPMVKCSGSKTLLWLVDNIGFSEESSDTCSSYPETDVSDASTLQTEVSNSEFDASRSTPELEEWNWEFDPEAIKYFRALTPVEIEWKPAPKKRNLSPIPWNGDGFVSVPVSPSWRVESALMTSTPIPRPPEIKQVTEKEKEALNKSERDRLCRKEISRGIKIRKQGRMAMEEEEKQWKSKFMSEIKIVEDPSYYVQRPIKTNKMLVQQELDALKERLKTVEATETPVKSLSFRNKFKAVFKRDVENKNDKIKRERKEKIDIEFKRSEDKLSRHMGDDWRKFLLHQNCHHEMLKKARLQEEMIYYWKSDAIHYKNLHALLKSDYLEGKKDSWYVTSERNGLWK